MELDFTKNEGEEELLMVEGMSNPDAGLGDNVLIEGSVCMS